ncbi:SAM-dependent methyltransferase [Streptosporangium sp. CA-135522]|uniref:SAM-dependent methyltransferase n=1 Tax=Streptosporangium sp. CA-135522 TaxID=3240072 RepID=UPI003D90656C
MSDDHSMPVGIDTTVPHPARVYDYVLGGKNNYAVDRDYADMLVAQAPDYPPLARANRLFLSRTVEFMAQAGIRQFIDLGTGIPTSPNVHEIAREIHPGAKVVYVDNDPIVSVHNDALLATDDRVVSIRADLRDSESILADPELNKLIDFDEPVGVLFVAVLQFFPGPEVPARIVSLFRERMAPGSHIAISQPSAEGDPEAVARARAAMAGGPLTIDMRLHDEILPFFDGFDLVEPGLVDVTKWRPRMDAPFTRMLVLGGVGRKSA